MTKNLFSRILRGLVSRVSVALGHDIVTGETAQRRSDLLHLGSKEGGWVIPKSKFRSESVCYCAGCGEDISFDLSLIETFHCDVWAFDPTPKSVVYVRAIVKDLSAYHFVEIGLWDSEDVLKFFAPKNEAHVSHSLVNLQRTDKYIEVKVRRLSDIMKENGHDRLDLLKLDIEGAEYRVIDSIIEDGLDIQVLCIEFDEYWNPLDGNYRGRIRSHVRKLLSAGYQLIDFRGNGNYTFLKAG
jgi:FkbM family methyltransferase